MSEKSKTKKNLAELKDFFRNVRYFLFADSLEEAKYRVKVEKELKNQIKPAVRFGLVIILICVFIFGIWGGTAPLDSASIASGFITLSGNRKTIQHFEGGVIEKILVKEGDRVKEGQELVILNPTHPRSELHSILSYLRAATALEKRLIAESQEQDSIDFSSNFLDPSIPEVQTLIRNQQSLFESKNKAFHASINVLKQRILQSQESIKGFQAQLRSNQERRKLNEQQLQSIQALFDKGLATKTSLLDFQRIKQELEGQNGEIASKISEAKEVIIGSESQILNTIQEHKSKISEEYKSNHERLLDYEEKYNRWKDVLERTIIRAPNSGIITSLSYHTVGGIVGPGSKIMDIVPEDDELIAEVRVLPQDIDSIRVGTIAKVQLNAYKQRLVPRISGEVIYVSADKVVNERVASPGEPPQYYVAKIKIDPESINSLSVKVELQPGMPVTAFLVKGTRTFLQYLISPITDSFHKAFKEA